jgi:hypothetical protein
MLWEQRHDKIQIMLVAPPASDGSRLTTCSLHSINLANATHRFCTGVMRFMT